MDGIDIEYQRGKYIYLQSARNCQCDLRISLSQCEDRVIHILLDQLLLQMIWYHLRIKISQLVKRIHLIMMYLTSMPKLTMIAQLLSMSIYIINREIQTKTTTLIWAPINLHLLKHPFYRQVICGILNPIRSIWSIECNYLVFAYVSKNHILPIFSFTSIYFVKYIFEFIFLVVILTKKTQFTLNYHI